MSFAATDMICFVIPSEEAGGVALCMAAATVKRRTRSCSRSFCCFRRKQTDTTMMFRQRKVMAATQMATITGKCSWAKILGVIAS